MRLQYWRSDYHMYTCMFVHPHRRISCDLSGLKTIYYSPMHDIAIRFYCVISSTRHWRYCFARQLKYMVYDCTQDAFTSMKGNLSKSEYARRQLQVTTDHHMSLFYTSSLTQEIIATHDQTHWYEWRTTRLHRCIFPYDCMVDLMSTLSSWPCIKTVNKQLTLLLLHVLRHAWATNHYIILSCFPSPCLHIIC